ncbi:hypothetical protein B0H17DRAFT_1197505 [Mycena rosella]|uniref:Uncharacterized protein n=1 Tax=Mycena rosella TaxID=1033263 RepID=A0AAD7GJ56_MYCRO|nr:hypothetical protein B0H17DRAFT_1197505 [Mycena rosella]
MSIDAYRIRIRIPYPPPSTRAHPVAPPRRRAHPRPASLYTLGPLAPPAPYQPHPGPNATSGDAQKARRGDALRRHRTRVFASVRLPDLDSAVRADRAYARSADARAAGWGGREGCAIRGVLTTRTREVRNARNLAHARAADTRSAKDEDDSHRTALPPPSPPSLPHRTHCPIAPSPQSAQPDAPSHSPRTRG